MIHELEEKIKDIEHKFKVDKALMERDFHTSHLETGNATFKRGRQAMMSMFTKPIHEFDGGKRVFILDWVVFLRWVNVLEQRKANLHGQ